ncbi:hypothetical protein Cgig2_012296 [Carnegiea gigantea]|uniref:Uncharacterized protein n=1 Tax=Carnegiea gigantea TaxID=171969 RepID=A0A9Q1GL26_9CARY|nr:hypothetical protein Cgig2_012296 [Carnegiea gigantea]
MAGHGPGDFFDAIAIDDEPIDEPFLVEVEEEDQEDGDEEGEEEDDEEEDEDDEDENQEEDEVREDGDEGEVENRRPWLNPPMVSGIGDTVKDSKSVQLNSGRASSNAEGDGVDCQKEWNREEVEGLCCPICMEPWCNSGDHQPRQHYASSNTIEKKPAEEQWSKQIEKEQRRRTSEGAEEKNQKNSLWFEASEGEEKIDETQNRRKKIKKKPSVGCEIMEGAEEKFLGRSEEHVPGVWRRPRVSLEEKTWRQSSVESSWRRLEGARSGHRSSNWGPLDFGSSEAADVPFTGPHICVSVSRVPSGRRFSLSPLEEEWKRREAEWQMKVHGWQKREADLCKQLEQLTRFSLVYAMRGGWKRFVAIESQSFDLAIVGIEEDLPKISENGETDGMTRVRQESLNHWLRLLVLSIRVVPSSVMPSPPPPPPHLPPPPPPPLGCYPKCGFIGEPTCFLRFVVGFSTSVPEALEEPATPEELTEISRSKGKHQDWDNLYQVRKRQELLLDGARHFDVDDSGQVLIVARRPTRIGGSHILTKMSLFSPQEQDNMQLPSTIKAVRDLHVSPFGRLALLASMGKKLSLVSMESNNVVVDYDLPVQYMHSFSDHVDIYQGCILMFCFSLPSSCGNLDYS